MGTPSNNFFDLTGQVALVTGGSRGLGLQMAEALGEAGAKVMLTSRKAADLEEAAPTCRPGIDARWIAADASKPDEAQRVVAETLERLGRIDILVNNAGATWGAPAEDHPLEAWDKVMNLNVRSLFLFAQAVAKASMIPAARAASSTSSALPAWAATRRAWSSSPTTPARARWSTSPARWPPSGASTGITVNAIAPGFFPSKMTQGTARPPGRGRQDGRPRRCSAWATTTT
jgi:NAD(P)-dependent dehydrogenase (short-subunit alcohol dehydrogenase family)